MSETAPTAKLETEEVMSVGYSTIVVPTALRKNPIYITVYINWMYLIVMYAIPFGILVVFNYK